MLLLLVVFGFPKLDIQFGFFWLNILALTMYTSTFVCEALAIRRQLHPARSG